MIRNIGRVLWGNSNIRTQPCRYFSNDFMNKLTEKLKVKQKLLQIKESQIVIEQKNDCIYIHDENNQYGFLSEVKTQEGTKGVVIDIRDKVVGIALYTPVKEVKNVEPTQLLAGNMSNELKVRRIYDVEERDITSTEAGTGKTLNLKKEPQRSPSPTFSRVRQTRKEPIPILNPLLRVCQQINYGDFLLFEGPYGTGKTTAALEIAKVFPKSEKSIVLYLNFSLKDCQKVEKQLNNLEIDWIAFSQREKQRSDAGGLMLALKVTTLAKTLRQNGYHVLVIVENLNEILRRQISMLKNFQQVLAPFSIVNQLYCQSGSQSNIDSGDLTTIITLQEQSTKNKVDVGYMGITPYVNSLTHVHSLAVPIKFPLQLKINQNPRPISRYVNQVLQLQNEFELKSKLKLNTEPWQNYFLHDSKWWTNSLKKFRAESAHELQLFIFFLQWSIEHDYVSHWTIQAHQAFKLLKKWLQSHSIPMTVLVVEKQQKSSEILEAFLMHCKVEGTFSPYKNDYLS